MVAMDYMVFEEAAGVWERMETVSVRKATKDKGACCSYGQ